MLVHAHFFIMKIDFSKKKKKALCLVGFYLLPWTRNRLLSLYGLKLIKTILLKLDKHMRFMFGSRKLFTYVCLLMSDCGWNLEKGLNFHFS